VRRLVAAVLLLGACHPPPPAVAGPGDVLAAYQAALRAGKLDDAWALLSSKWRATHDRAGFERTLSPDDKRAAETRLRGARVELEAEVETADGEKLPLVFEDGAWKLARDPLDFYPQATPKEALRSFIRAVQLLRWDVALRFVPTRYRQQITVEKLRDRWQGERRSELVASLELVRLHLRDPLEPGASDEEVRLPLGEKKQAKLVREGTAWKIEALE
jgi:hypothetical protein